ncbi:hypothetical protein [Lysobacter antibioticus]|uniref:hypothetical protein n=1 Tax=Lysobacter antibioticus TaxID=84531 RepID=UPI001187672C|nr:hypothetical protein [Lysobacter antibioticus]
MYSTATVLLWRSALKLAKLLGRRAGSSAIYERDGFVDARRREDAGAIGEMISSRRSIEPIRSDDRRARGDPPWRRVIASGLDLMRLHDLDRANNA